MKNFKIISTYFRVTQVNKKETFLLIFFSLLSNVPYLFISLLFSIAIRYLTDKNIPMLLWTIIVYFALKLLSKVSQILNLMMERRFHNDVYLKLQSQIIDKLDQIKIQYFSDHSKGEMLNIANGDIKVMAEFGTWLSQEILLFVSVIVSIVVLGKISIGLMILGCVVNSTVIYILNKYNEKYEVLMREGKEKSDEEMQFFSELIVGLKDVKIFQILSQLRKRYRICNDAYIEVHNRQIQNRIISNIISPSITMCTEILLLTYACYHCLQGTFGIETVLIIQSYFGTLFSSLSEFVSALGELRVKKVSVDRYNSFIQSEQNEEFLQYGKIKAEGYDICAEDMSFSYGEHPIFKEYSLNIAPNTLCALTGPSGCGKSTFFHLLLRFEKAKKGQIRIGGTPIGLYPKEQYSGLLTCVLQQPYFFHMSVYENLALIDRDFEKIRKACKDAGIDEYIMSLPEQYDTILEEGAANFSGGQRQRLAIARALLKEAKILLLDEVTSALDVKTASEIMETVSKLKKNHTILMISHKPGEYKWCDRIIPIEKSRAE
ncbi:hypothetical protein B5F13_07455 [Drancourtella sp. An177]|nr:hypothetical protein B5F13_07455 [Drancourtella sp. An177]